MNKIKVLIGVSVIFVILSGCGMSTVEDTEKAPYFIEISKEYNGSIVYDTRTNVEYWLSNGAYNHGTLTPLYNADGSLMVYKEGK